MPDKKPKKKLEESGKKKGFIGRKLEEYIYDYLRKKGWKPKKEHKKLAKPGK